MDNLVDFEALIDINEVLVTMEKIEREVQNISQNSLIDAFDKMCDEDDIKNSEITTVNADSNLSIKKNTGCTDDLINADNFGDIFNEMRMSVDTLEKLRQREFSITDINTENNIPKIVQPTHVISENDPAINLDEFEMIFNDICVSNCKIENESILSDTQTQKEETVTSNNVIDVDEIADKLNDDTVGNDINKIVTDNLKPYGQCSLENQATVTLKPNKTENYVIIDLDSAETDTDCNNIMKHEIKKRDNLKTIVSKETGIITLSSDSEDDGYNSSDFEFITESEAKKNCLAKTSIQNYSYYNADYMKYHKSRYLPCKVISSKAKRESHVIPQGQTYLDLFRGMYAPAVVNNLYYASRKRVLPVTSMTIQDGYGFDVYENKCEENQEYKNEANESLKKIRFLYPEENRERRRSRRF
ncbi:uncharacterized protein isoform X2 [Choristoneura fumiferana]